MPLKKGLFYDKIPFLKEEASCYMQLRIRKIMADKGMRITDLSRLSGIEYNTLRRIVSKESTVCKLETLIAIAAALDVSLCELIDDSRLVRCNPDYSYEWLAGVEDAKESGHQEGPVTQNNKLVGTILETLTDFFPELMPPGNLEITASSMKVLSEPEPKKQMELCFSAGEEKVIKFTMTIAREQVMIVYQVLDLNCITLEKNYQLAKLVGVPCSHFVATIKENGYSCGRFFRYEGNFFDGFNNLGEIDLANPQRFIAKRADSPTYKF